MAILPSTQDVTQFLGSSVGKPVDFNPMQQSQTGPGGQPTQQPHPQQPMQMPPSPYMPSGGPYNPYSQWAKLMQNGPGGHGLPQTMPQPQPMGGNVQAAPQTMPQPNVQVAPRPMGMPNVQAPPRPMGGNPSMMQGMFRGPMVR